VTRTRTVADVDGSAAANAVRPRRLVQLLDRLDA
jgi:hypothetical protein